VSGIYYQVRAYNVRHRHDVNSFLEAYRRLLQKAVDEIWAEIRWIEKYDRRGRKKAYTGNSEGQQLQKPLPKKFVDGWLELLEALRWLGNKTGMLNHKVLEEKLH
jgi:hypothetical protein